MRKGEVVMKKKPPESRLEHLMEEREQDKSEAEDEKKKAIRALPGLFADKKPNKYTMNTIGTIEHMSEYYQKKGEKAEDFFTSRLAAGKGPHIRLQGTSEDFYLTGNEASGQFLTAEMPGEDAMERREKLQLPASNDGEDLYRVNLKEPHIVIESTVVKQEEYAEQSGYKARDGMKQYFVPPKYGDTRPGVKVVEHLDGSRPHISEKEQEEKKHGNDEKTDRSSDDISLKDNRQ